MADPDRDPDDDVTILLRQANAGDAQAPSRLFQKVEAQLRAIANKSLHNEAPDAELQETVLVHDAFLNLVGEKGIDWTDRRHFFVLAAKSMRRALVDKARKRAAAKRGGPDARRADVDLDRFSEKATDDEVIVLHEALKKLALAGARRAEIVEMRHFGGYTIDEIAKLQGVSPTTVKQDLVAAKEWLRRELNGP